MADNKKSTDSGSSAGGLLNWGKGGWTKILGDMLGIYVLVYAPLVIIAAAAATIDYFDHMHGTGSKRACWSLQQVAGSVYKVNACTGETVKLDASGDTRKPAAGDGAPQP